MFTLPETSKETVKAIEKRNMPESPTRWSVRRPARSMRGIDTRVMETMMPPTASVAYLACSGCSPTSVNRAVE